MYKERRLKNLPSSQKKQHPYYSRLNALIEKKITVNFQTHDNLTGVLLGFDQQHLNLCLSVNGKLVFVRGNAYLSFSEG